MDEWLADGARSTPPYPAGRFASLWNNCPGNEVSLFIPAEMIDGIVGDHVPSCVSCLARTDTTQRSRDCRAGRGEEARSRAPKNSRERVP